MATERISISNSKLVTKNAANKVTFDSDNKYLKTTASGTFNLGGYQRAPAIICRGDENASVNAKKFGIAPTDNLGVSGFPVLFFPQYRTYRNFAPSTFFSPQEHVIYNADSTKYAFPNTFPETADITKTQTISAEVGPFSEFTIAGLPQTIETFFAPAVSYEFGNNFNNTPFSWASQSTACIMTFESGSMDLYKASSTVNITFTPYNGSPYVIGTARWYVIIYQLYTDYRHQLAIYDHYSNPFVDYTGYLAPAFTANRKCQWVINNVDYHVMLADFVRNTTPIGKNSGGVISVTWTKPPFAATKVPFALQSLSDDPVYDYYGTPYFYPITYHEDSKRIDYAQNIESATPFTQFNIKTGDSTFNVDSLGRGAPFVGRFSAYSYANDYLGLQPLTTGVLTNDGNTSDHRWNYPLLHYAKFHVPAFATLKQERLNYIITP